MEWVKLQSSYDSLEKALEVANIVATTESRLASQPRGPQYEVETRVEQVDNQWQVFWRKVVVASKSGCGGGCGSCASKSPRPSKEGKVIPFRRPLA